MNENLENVETVNCSSCKAEIPTGMKLYKCMVKVV